MTKTQTAPVLAGVPRHNIFASPIGPRILLEAPNDQGAAEAAAKAAADAAAKEAADKAAKEAADKAAAEAAGKNAPTDAEAKLLKEVMEKKDALKAANDKLAAFDGIDPAEYKALKAAAEKAEADKRAADLAAAEAAGNFDRVKAMMVEEHTKATKTLEQQIADLQAQLAAKDGVVQELTVGQSFAQSTFVKDELVLTPAKARQIYGSHFETEGGKVVAYDKPRGAAERTKIVDGTGSPMGFEDALKKLVAADPDHDQLVRSKLKPGAQSTTTDAKPGDKPAEVTGAARIALALQKAKAGKA